MAEAANAAGLFPAPVKIAEPVETASGANPALKRNPSIRHEFGVTSTQASTNPDHSMNTGMGSPLGSAGSMAAAAGMATAGMATAGMEMPPSTTILSGPAFNDMGHIPANLASIPDNDTFPDLPILPPDAPRVFGSALDSGLP